MIGTRWTRGRALKARRQAIAGRNAGRRNLQGDEDRLGPCAAVPISTIAAETSAILLLDAPP